MDSLPPDVTDARPLPDGLAVTARPLPHGLAASLVFLASGAVLVLETVSLRLVGPYVGVTLQVTSSVIGVALAAIAYGAWLGGWLADRRDPRTLLAPALVLAGIATAVTLPMVRYAGEVLRGGAIPAILLLTTLTVFLPAALLAAVTPLVVKLQLGDLRRTGQVVGRLSSIGTLGGITATLGTGFVLVAALPSTVIMVGLAVLLGVAGIALGVYLRGRGRAAVPGRARTRAAVAIVGLAGATLSTVAPTPCGVETAYHCASVVAELRPALLRGPCRSDPSRVRLHAVDRRGGGRVGAGGAAAGRRASGRRGLHHPPLPDRDPPRYRKPGLRDRRGAGAAGPERAGGPTRPRPAAGRR
jgi:MFS family permease